jgi:hypothetical protein
MLSGMEFILYYVFESRILRIIGLHGLFKVGDGWDGARSSMKFK